MAEYPQDDTIPSEAEIAARLRRQRLIIAGIVLLVLILLAGIGWAVYFLLQDSSKTANIRDIFIIFMAFESLIIGMALVVLIVQIASLINLIQNEVKPILEATNETVNTLRGTTAFLSENLVEPVIKLNSTIAGLRQILKIFGIKQRK